MSYFDHEKLDVYVAAIDFVVVANAVVGRLPRGNAYLADQLLRAATSISFNIAEGAGESAEHEKARFYRIARRSATECAAILHVCEKLEVADKAVLAQGRDLLLRVVAMLTKIVRVHGRSS